jgi:ATP-dependent protease Clp ATPase subunit
MMLDVMYQLPDQAPGSKYVIDEEIVAGRKHLFGVTPLQKKSA